MKKFLIFLTACFLLIVTYFGISETIRKYQIEKNYKIAEEIVSYVYKREFNLDIVLEDKTYDNGFPPDIGAITLWGNFKNHSEYGFFVKIELKNKKKSTTLDFDMHPTDKYPLKDKLIELQKELDKTLDNDINIQEIYKKYNY